MDEDILARVRIVVSVQLRHPARGSPRAWLVRKHVSGARKRGRIGRILLVTTFDEHHADIECQCGDDEEDDQPAGEENQDLTALIT